MIFDSFLFSKHTEPLPDTLLAAFDKLSPDTIAYNKTGTSTRFRNFGAFRFVDGEFVSDNAATELFNARRDFHMTHAHRQPDDMENALSDRQAIPTLLDEIAPSLPVDMEHYAIGMNLIRVTADDDRMVSPAPGLHQDGYDFSCHFSIARQNVAGGTSIISRSANAEDVILEHCLNPREFIFFNDRALYHTATAVTCRIGGVGAIRDMIIMDFVRR